MDSKVIVKNIETKKCQDCKKNPSTVYVTKEKVSKYLCSSCAKKWGAKIPKEKRLPTLPLPGKEDGFTMTTGKWQWGEKHGPSRVVEVSPYLDSDELQSLYVGEFLVWDFMQSVYNSQKESTQISEVKTPNGDRHKVLFTDLVSLIVKGEEVIGVWDNEKNIVQKYKPTPKRRFSLYREWFSKGESFLIKSGNGRFSVRYNEVDNTLEGYLPFGISQNDVISRIKARDYKIEED